MDVKAEQVLQPVVAVPAATALPPLHQPGPDIFRCGIDGDGARPADVLQVARKYLRGAYALSAILPEAPSS